MRITWWGHATTTLELGGLRLLTDPVLTATVAHLRRRRGPAPRAEALQADLVLLSHLHHDHLHPRSLRRLPADAQLLAPRGTVRLLRSVRAHGLAGRCTELAPGDELGIGGVAIAAVPARHDGRRSPGSRHRGPALGFVLRSPHGSAWFAGDTDLHEEMSTFGPVDVALVPVAGWGPSLGPGHLDPVRAAEAVRRVRADIAVPIHYGTLWPRGMDRVRPELFLGPEQEFVRQLAMAAPTVTVRVLAPGASTSYGGAADGLTPTG